MRKRTSFTKLIQLWGIILLIGIGVSIVAIDVIASYRDYCKTNRVLCTRMQVQRQNH
jgi:hypothetical protein